MFGTIGPMEIALIAGVLLLIFGPSQIPKLGRSLGKSIVEFRGAGRELRKALNGDDSDDNEK